MENNHDPEQTLAHVPEIGGTTLTVAPASGSTGAAVPSPQGYEMLAEIGRGGMGVVYKARQRSLNRIVALKVILGSAHSSSAQYERFRAEATAVASLQHRNIVQVYETGELDGQPFMALEYVEGGSLAEYLHGEPQHPPVAAEMVRLLALAVQHAHERGVVHRDLKPANVLLTMKLASPLRHPSELNADLKITDFGLAKQAGESHLTATGAILGTPSYMAPEQATGDGANVGPTTDVYALGAILYECLVGRPPFRSTTPMETVLQVIHTEPVPPRHIQPTVPNDLDTICLKCLAKKPEQRYASAVELADDLRRYLTGEPILARPVGRITKAWKWAKRHPALAISAFVFAVPMPILLGVMVYLFIDARNARLDETRALQQAERDRETAQAYLKSTIATMDRILERIGDQRLARLAGFQEDREAILKEGVDLYEALLQVDMTDPTVRHETAQSHIRLAKLWLMTGRSRETGQSAQAAIDLLTTLKQEFPDRADYRHDLAKAMQLLSTARVIELDYAGSMAASKQSSTICEELIAQDPKEMKYHATACEAHRMMAMFHTIADPPAALAEFELARKHAETAYQASPSADEYRGLLALTLAMYGKYLVATNRLASAEPMLQQTQKLLAQPNHARSSVSSRDFLENASMMNRAALGELLLRRGSKEAIPVLQTVLDDYEALIKAMPKSFPYRVQATQTYMAQLQAFKRADQHTDILRVAQRGIAIIDDILRDQSQSVWLLPLRQRFNVERALAHYALGQSKEATGLASELDRSPQRLNGIEAYNLACLFAMLAAKAEGSTRDDLALKAIHWLKHGSATGYPNSASTLEHAKTADPDLAILRVRPDFQAWLATIKLEKKSSPTLPSKK